MAITGYDYNYTGNGAITTVNIPGLSASNTFTGSQTFVGNIQSDSTTTGTLKIAGGLGVQNGLIAGAVWGAIWNDLADCIDVPEDTDLEPGYAYCFDGKKYYKSDKYLADGFVGIHSDTAGFFMGKDINKKQLQVSVGGFILVYIDKEYPIGTPLTITENGFLTKIEEKDILLNPHKIVGTFWKKELNKTYGPKSNQINVNDRMWIKVK